MRNGACSQSVTAPLYHSFLLTLFICSSMDLSHMLQSFKINLLLCGLSTGCSSFRNIHFLQCGVLHRLQCGYLLHHDPLQWLQENLCSGTWSTSSLSSSPLGAHRADSNPHCQALVCPSLHRLFPRCHHCRCAAQLCPAVSLLELAGICCVWHGVTLASPHRGHLAACCQPLGTCTQCTLLTHS